MKVKLEHLEVFVTLDKSQCQVVDARKQIANIIYSQGQVWDWQDRLLPLRCGTEVMKPTTRRKSSTSLRGWWRKPPLLVSSKQSARQSMNL